MIITSKPMAIILLAAIFGGILFSSYMDWWATESDKQPVAFAEGEFAGRANPADIRGAYAFGDIAASFDVDPQTLAQAFGVVTEDPAAFEVKSLEELYSDSAYEIGTSSIRLFVAYYAGLPFSTEGLDIYLAVPASEILTAKGNLDAERFAYVEAHTVDVSMPAAAITPAGDLAAALTAAPLETDTTVKGKTTFGELLAWGVAQERIEALIGGPIPDPAVSVKDYASANGLDFDTLKPALQADVDKVK